MKKPKKSTSDVDASTHQKAKAAIESAMSQTLATPLTVRLRGYKLPKKDQLKRKPSDLSEAREILRAEQARASRPSAFESPLAALRQSVDKIATDHSLTHHEIVGLLNEIVRAYETRAALTVTATRNVPSKAPALWAQRDPDARQNPVQFFNAVYSEWAGQGLTRKDLRQLDADLYRAITVWEARHPEDKIVGLPRRTEIVDQQVEQLTLLFAEDELRKLATVLQARYRRLR